MIDLLFMFFFMSGVVAWGFVVLIIAKIWMGK